MHEAIVCRECGESKNLEFPNDIDPCEAYCPDCIGIVEARELAAQAWCTPSTENKQMDPQLAYACARVLKVWIDTAKQHCKNEMFYMGLLDKCAESIGKEAYIADDGVVHDSPLRLKIPELVAKLVGELKTKD